jgi:hypothetical protein
MTQEPRTTESESRDNAAIREIMHRIKELTVPDRATLALGLIGHLATLMNGRQMEKLLLQLTEEASKVQDVPPSRQGGQTNQGSPVQSGGQNAAAPEGGPVGQSGRGAVTESSSEIL